MDKATLLATLDAERARWEEALARLDETRMLQPGAVGEWSVKDLIAHILWSEREMVGLIQNRSLQGGSPLWYLPQDERNARVYAENRDRPLAEVLREESEIYAQLRGLLAGLSQEDLLDPQRFGMPPQWTPWQIFAGSSFEHYRHHLPALES